LYFEVQRAPFFAAVAKGGAFVFLARAGISGARADRVAARVDAQPAYLGVRRLAAAFAQKRYGKNGIGFEMRRKETSRAVIFTWRP
jgi:hypothetical protein